MNRARGEVHLDIAGKRHALCLTLGALAEIEAALGADGLLALEGRMARVSARDLVAIAGALLRGGGHPYTDEEVAALPLDLAVASRAVTEAFAAAGLAGGAAGPEQRSGAGAGNPPAPPGQSPSPGGA